MTTAVLFCLGFMIGAFIAGSYMFYVMAKHCTVESVADGYRLVSHMLAAISLITTSLAAITFYIHFGV